jgi:hypothetical protein
VAAVLHIEKQTDKGPDSMQQVWMAPHVSPLTRQSHRCMAPTHYCILHTTRYTTAPGCHPRCTPGFITYTYLHAYLPGAVNTLILTWTKPATPAELPAALQKQWVDQVTLTNHLLPAWSCTNPWPNRSPCPEAPMPSASLSGGLRTIATGGCL